MPILDTDIIIDYLRQKEQSVKELDKLRNGKNVLKTTIFNVGELYKGAYYSSNVGKSVRVIDDLLKKFEIIHFTLEDSQIYGRISAELKKSGVSIGTIDELIASIVINRNETLITRNIDHYNKIPRISLYNWDTSTKKKP